MIFLRFKFEHNLNIYVVKLVLKFGKSKSGGHPASSIWCRTAKQFFILKNDFDAEIRQEKLLETCWKKERNLFNPGSTTNPDSSKVHHY